jgi:putative ABC transport system permease protein
MGIATRLGAAAGLTRLMSALLFGVNPIDPGTYCAVSILLGFVARLACYPPAWRASGVDPVEASRWE